MENENAHITDDVEMITAVQQNDERQVKQLIERGQNQVTLDSGLCWAARLGYLPLIIILIEGGADPNSEVWGGFSPLIWVTIFSGNTDVIRYLVNSGADVDHSSSKRKQTALHAAAIKGDTRLVQCLIDVGASLDVQDYLYKTPLLHAVQRNLQGCVKILIRNNCNVNLPGFVNGTRLSPLLVALLQSNLELTKMLILAGAKFEQTAIYQTYTLAHYYKLAGDCLNLEVRPVYLQQQCRVSIRELLKPQFLQKLQQIELPPLLREFLSMEELNRVF